MKIRLIAATLLLLPVSVALFAQDGKQQHDGHRGDHARGGLERLDTDNDGRISRAEFDKGRAERDARMAQHAERADRDGKRKHEAPDFTVLDTNKDGQLSKPEFMAAAPTSASTPPNGAALVTKLDANKDGKVSADEYRAPILGTFDRADTNKDGTLSPNERQAAGQAARKN